jgi:hypothetical protein
MTMTRKTDGEKIDELEKIVATLDERLDNVRREMVDRERLAVVEERLNELKKTIVETSRGHWLVWSSVAGGIVGAFLTFLGQLVLNSLKK